MNLRKQVEPLKKAALQASSLQRHAHHAASRLTWIERWLKRAYRHHAQSRELKNRSDATSKVDRVQLIHAAQEGRRANFTELRKKDAIEEALEFAGPLGQFAVARLGDVATAE